MRTVDDETDWQELSDQYAADGGAIQISPTIKIDHELTMDDIDDIFAICRRIENERTRQDALDLRGKNSIVLPH